MESIAYSAPTATTSSTRRTTSQPQHAPAAAPNAAGDVAPAPILVGDYLVERWLPVLGPDKFALVCALRSLCYHDPATGEFITEFALDLAALAAKAGLTRSKLCRLLKRDKQGVILDAQPDGTTCKSWLNLFVTVRPDRRYSPEHGREIQTRNTYCVTWRVPPVPGDEAYYALLCSASQIEIQKPATGTPAHPRATAVHASAATCLYETPAHLENLTMRQQRSFSSLEAKGITSNGRYRTINERQPNSKKSIRNAHTTPRLKKALVGGEGASETGQQQIGSKSKSLPRHAPVLAPGNQAEKELSRAFEVALLAAEQAAGGVLVDLLQQYGDPNPLVGMRTILVALVKAGAPNERLSALAYLGRNRLRRFQLRGGHIQTTVPGYFINLMRNLAGEARGKNWDTEHIEAEDQIKHAEILRRIATRGTTPQCGYIEPEAEPAEEAEEPTEEMQEGAEPREAEEEEPMPEVSEAALEDALPAAEGESDTTWVESLLPTVPGMSGHRGNVGMLWGFVRDELHTRPNMYPARKQCLWAVTPAVDPANPRELLLLSTNQYTARLIEWTLLREIDALCDKLLYHVFDEVRPVYVPCLPAWAAQEEEHA